MNPNLNKLSFASIFYTIQLSIGAGLLGYTGFVEATDLQINPGITGRKVACVTAPDNVQHATSTFQNTLPLTLISFTAEKTQSGKIELVWKTAQEVSTSHFNVERSTDGRKWTKLGSRSAKGFQGSIQSYTFTDAKPSGNINYYRLQVVEDDNSASYSSVRMVYMGTSIAIRVYPTLATNTSTFFVEGISPEKAQIELFTNEGRPAYKTRLYSNTFVLPNVFPGIYHVRVTDISQMVVVGQQKLVLY